MTFIHDSSPSEAMENEAFLEALAMSDDPADRAVAWIADALPKPGEPDWTYADQRRAFDILSDHVGEWHGLPIPLPELRLHLHDRHPLAGFYLSYEIANMEPFEHSCSSDDVDETEYVVNSWYSKRLPGTVVIVHNKHGVQLVKLREPSLRRFDLNIRTMVAMDAWDLAAEAKAIEKLAGLLSKRQLDSYLFTGNFIETSERSQVMYMFRKLRPTVALSQRLGYLKFLTALCLHPLGYYRESYAGCMVPTDDVIAHLLLMRGDEAQFWGKANHHRAHEPEAGL